jgi:parvulin-like peptidyl-prolyl isomerase
MNPRRPRHGWSLLALILLAVTGLAAATPTPLFDDVVLVRGRGFTIRQSEIDDALAALRGTLATQGQQIAREEEPVLRQRMLDRMTLSRILAQRASAEDQAEARKLADKFIADTKSKAPSEESYRRQLLATGLKPEVFETRALEQAVVERVIDRELKSKLTVPPSEVQDFYDFGHDVNTRELAATIARLEAAGNQDTVFYRDATNRFQLMRRSNLSRLNRPDQTKASLILIYTIDPVTRARLSEEGEKAKLRLATNTVARLKAGEDFAKVAREISEDPDVGRTGGEYVSTSATNMAPELLAALSRLPLGEISAPILTRFGVYIARVKERSPAMKYPLGEVEKDIRDLLLMQMVEKRLPAYTEQLKKEYEVVVTAPSPAE